METEPKNLSISNLDMDEALSLLFEPDTDLDEFARQNGIPAVRITHKWGHGQWHYFQHEDRLMRLCAFLDARYPGGNHRIEYREIETPHFSQKRAEL